MSAIDAVDGSTTAPPTFMGISWGCSRNPTARPTARSRPRGGPAPGEDCNPTLWAWLNVRFALKATELLRGREMTRCANTGLMQRSKIARRYSITLSGRTHPQREERL